MELSQELRQEADANHDNSDNFFPSREQLEFTGTLSVAAGGITAGAFISEFKAQEALKGGLTASAFIAAADTLRHVTHNAIDKAVRKYHRKK